MTATRNNRCQQLTEKISVLLADGIKAGETVFAYMASTFSNPSLNEIKKMILDESHIERDSLVDLFLFPDEAFQLKLEPFLTRYRFTGTDEQHVIHHLSAMRPSVVIHLSAFNGHLRLGPTPSEVRQLIIRLNITWRAEKLIRRAIENHIAPVRQPLVSVRLRNADLKIDESGARFFCRFLDVFDDAQERFFEYFDFLVDFLGRIPSETPYKNLMREKRRMVMTLEQTEKFKQLLTRGNMETLMLQGVRFPAEPTAVIRKNITIIDDIAVALFGRTESVRNIYPAFNMDLVRGGRKD
jgi:hypothetical protein